MWYDASVDAGSVGGKDYKMARTARIKKSNNGTARYHLMSRTNDRRFLFEKGRVKTQLVDALKRAAAFSGVELEAYVAMDNHFHIVCKVVRGGEELTEGELLRRVAALKGERAAAELASHWRELRDIGMESAVAEAQDRLRARMNDVSEFIKTFKELFNVWYKRERGYSGSIWDGRFKSLRLPEPRPRRDGEARGRLRLELDCHVRRHFRGVCPRREADEEGGADRGGEDIRKPRVRDGDGVCAG